MCNLSSPSSLPLPFSLSLTPQEVEIFVRCQMLLRRCSELIRQTWGIAHQELSGLWSTLSGVWMLRDKSKHLHEVCSQLDDMCTKTIPRVRSNLLSSLCSVSLICGLTVHCLLSGKSASHQVLVRGKSAARRYFSSVCLSWWKMGQCQSVSSFLQGLAKDSTQLGTTSRTRRLEVI